MHKYMMIGPQGSGKGTQSELLCKELDLSHISIGAIFRWHMQNHTKLAARIRRIMDKGRLVPDEIVEQVVRHRLEEHDWNHGFVLDGFPRTLHQASELDRVLGSHPLDVAINIDVPREIVLDRLAGRRVCENCQRVYHVNMPPASNWTCDTCGGQVVQRDDDTEEAIDRRLEIYERETVPIIDYYRERGVLEVVDGVGDGEEVYDRILKTVEDRLRSGSTS